MRKVASLIVAGFIAVVMASCSEAEQDFEPEPTEPTTTVAAPDVPELIEEKSEAGVRAFVTYYIDVLNHATVTGELDVLRSLSDQQCEGCEVLLNSVGDVYRSGGHYEDGAWEVESVTTTSHEAATHVVVGVSVHPGRLIRSRGVRAKNLEGHKMVVRFWLEWDLERWLVVDLRAKEDA